MLALLALAPLVALAGLGRLLLGSWLAPGPFFALYWSVAFAGPLVFAPGEQVAASALLWVFVAAGAVFAGSLFGMGSDISRASGWPPGPTGFSRARRPLAVAAAVCALLGLAAPLVPLLTQGYGLKVFTSLEALVGAAVDLSVGRYQETYSPPLLGQAALPFLYAAPAFAGLLTALRPRTAERFVIAGAFIPPLAVTATQTTRAVTVLAVVTWASTYLAARVLLGRPAVFTRAHVAAVVLGGALTTVVYFGAALARVGATDLGVIQEVAPKMHTGLFGHAAAFSQWFESRATASGPPAWGAYTFAGLYDALGMGQRQLGLFVESVVLANGEETNIYTVFRPLIEDCSGAGALAVLFVFGLLAGVAHRELRRGRFALVPVLTAFYITTLYGLLTSVWIYNSVLAGFGVFTLATLAYARYDSRRTMTATNALSAQPETAR